MQVRTQGYATIANAADFLPFRHDLPRLDSHVLQMPIKRIDRLAILRVKKWRMMMTRP